MAKNVRWRLLERKNVYDSKFLKVYEDKVELPNGKILDNYTVVEKPSIVIVVATTTDDRILALREYKYAAGKALNTLPAGHKKVTENPIEAARRELLEETGYSGDDFREVGILYDYPTKDLHKVYVVRAKNIAQYSEAQHEETESLTHHFVTIDALKLQLQQGLWEASSAIAALTVSGILF